MGTVSLKIILLFGDRAGAELGKEVAESLLEKLGPGFRVRQSSWSSELLRSPKLRALAAMEAREADIVMVAMDEGTPLPADMREWLDLWRDRQRAIPAALVALLKREDEDTPRVVEESLQAFADEARMDFFCHSLARHPDPRFRVNILEPELAAT
jgi:hypothetical protein